MSRDSHIALEISPEFFQMESREFFSGPFDRNRHFVHCLNVFIGARGTDVTNSRVWWYIKILTS